MDTEWIKAKTVTDEANNRKSLDIGAGKLTWTALLYHHFRAENCFCFCGCERNFTVALEMEIPPSALLNDALDRMIRNETILLKTGFAFCHPQDQYCKKTGRELAKSNLFHRHFIVNTISRHSKYVSLSLTVSPINENTRHDVLGDKDFDLRFFPNGVVMLLLC